MQKQFSSLDDIYNLSVIKVEAISDYKLLVTYSNDEVIEYSIKGILNNKLECLKDFEKFKKVFIDPLGNIAWDIDDKIDSNINWYNRIDISKETVYLEGKKV